MVLSPEYAWIELVIIGAVTVFVSDLIGNQINFRGRFMNALTTAVIFAIAFSVAFYLRFGTVLMTEWGFAMVRTPPA